MKTLYIQQAGRTYGYKILTDERAKSYLDWLETVRAVIPFIECYTEGPFEQPSDRIFDILHVKDIDEDIANMLSEKGFASVGCKMPMWDDYESDEVNKDYGE